MDTLIMLNGGHTTVVKDQTPQQIENELRSFMEGRADHSCKVAMFYIQTPQYGDNGLCIDPEAIVALIALN